ncbi:MAG: flagellar basal body P-ring formation protein FlgA [Gammaproteobacteria bacterium]|nr:flagellar basal body P-ring formation protein FlgA [Gammaproteobacteria bacterium]
MKSIVVLLHLMRSLLLLSLFTVITPVAGGEVEGYEPLASIRQAAEDFLLQELSAAEEEVEIEVGNLDARLRLQRCEQPLTAFFPPGYSERGGMITVGVKCEGGKPWSVYVRSTIVRYQEVIVATRNLSRGEIVSAADLQLQRRDTALLRGGFFTLPAAAIGQEVKRTVRADTVISHNMLQPPLVIKKGDRVTISAQTTGVKVTMTGKSLMNGAIGETIRVMNLSSKREISAVVTGQGAVEVMM